MVAYWLNSSGDVVGTDVSSWDVTDRGQPFIRSAGQTTYPDTFSGAWETRRINDHRDIAGHTGAGSHVGGLQWRAAIAPGDGGPGIDVHALLQPAHPSWSNCTGINNRRQVCGKYVLDPSGAPDGTGARGFVFDMSTGDLRHLGPLNLSPPVGISDTQILIGGVDAPEDPGYAYDLVAGGEPQKLTFKPIAISPNGQWIVGSSGSGARLWNRVDEDSDPVVVTLEGLGETGAGVHGVNNLGLAVGYSQPAPGTGEVDFTRAVLFEGGTAYDLNPMVEGTDWFITDAIAINDDGVIIANGVRPEHLRDWTYIQNHREALVLHPLRQVDPGGFYLGFEQLFGSPAIDGPGIGLINGKLRPIPPWDPEVWQAVWSTLSEPQRSILAGLGLSRYAEQLSDPHSRQSLSELGQKLITDSARKLTGEAGAPRLKLDARKATKLAKRTAGKNLKADDQVWKAVEDLIARRRLSSPR